MNKELFSSDRFNNCYQLSVFILFVYLISEIKKQIISNQYVFNEYIIIIRIFFSIYFMYNIFKRYPLVFTI